MSSSNSDPHTSNDSSDSTEPGDDPTTGVAGENTPDKLTEEIEILQANLVEWKVLKGDRQKPVQRRVRDLIQQLPLNEYIMVDDWKLKLKVGHILCMLVTAKIGLAY